MDSSSDGSFMWTDASDDTTESKNMAKQTVSLSGDESESGKSYKKKLQQRLLSNNCDDEKPDRKKRRFSEQHSDTTDAISPKKKRIKIEPESDIDTKKTKKKHKTLQLSQDSENDPYDEAYLNLKVENEHNSKTLSCIKTKKQKKKTSDVIDTSLTNGGNVTSEDYELQIPLNNETHSSAENTYVDKSENGIHKTKKKKKKSKTKNKYSPCDDSVNDRGSSANPDTEESCITGAESQPDVSADEPHNDISSILSDPGSDNVDETVSIPQKTTNRNNVTRRSTISERIMFEEECDTDILDNTSKTPIQRIHKTKSKLKSFIESSLRLRTFTSQLPIASVLSADDDLWLVKCPKDAKVEDFHGKKWILDDKCKIKLDGQTYEGVYNDNPWHVTILGNENDKTVIKNLEVRGCVRLRRRIPKAHIRDDNMIVNNQTNFIPLPETKCRHPLFGVHYKKAIKIPSAVTERLWASHSQPDTPASTGKRKKKSERRKSDSNEDTRLESSATLEDLTQTIENSTKKKKKKKRKQSDAEDGGPQQKRIKHDPESAEAWESEKAIEENLFNF